MAESLESKLAFFGKIINIAWKYSGLTTLSIGIGLFAHGCLEEEECNYDSQCTLDRICINNECVVDPNYNYEDIKSEKYEDTNLQPNICSKWNTYYLDNDGDGFGGKNTWICKEAPGFVNNNSDCDDNNSNIHPECYEKECGDDGCGGICGDCNGGSCVENQCIPDFANFDNICNVGGTCNLNEVCVPWCDYAHTFDHGEYVCCPKDKPQRLIYDPNPGGYDGGIHVCCEKCYESYSFIELPSDCVVGEYIL